MDTNKIISTLNTLLTRNYDSEKGYHKAAEHVKDPDLRRLMEIYADQRYHFGHDIKGEIKTLGGELDKGDSIAGKAHRTWMDIKAALSSDDDETMLEEAIKGEKKAINDYRDALKEDLPDNTRRILNDHLSKIEESLYQIQELEQQY